MVDRAQTALRDVNPASASAENLLELGMMYCTGHDVELNLIQAHKWLNLAALKGSIEAKEYRCEISREMSPGDIAEAQRQARAWLTLH
ncbi:MAG TPA: hypothetical protein PKE19_02665 [Aestuariivirga sp.]|nr:hypothetical protein [Aestuariivirga sp.]